MIDGAPPGAIYVVGGCADPADPFDVVAAVRSRLEERGVVVPVGRGGMDFRDLLRAFDPKVDLLLIDETDFRAPPAASAFRPPPAAVLRTAETAAAPVRDIDVVVALDAAARAPAIAARRPGPGLTADAPAAYAVAAVGGPVDIYGAMLAWRDVDEIRPMAAIVDVGDHSAAETSALRLAAFAEMLALGDRFEIIVADARAEAVRAAAAADRVVSFDRAASAGLTDAEFVARCVGAPSARIVARPDDVAARVSLFTAETGGLGARRDPERGAAFQADRPLDDLAAIVLRAAEGARRRALEAAL